MNLLRRLYRNETDFPFIATRKRWYIASAIVITICLASMLFKGFNFGIEFAGGTSFVFTKPANVTAQQAEDVLADVDVIVQTSQEAGSGAERKIVLRTEGLSDEQREIAARAISDNLGVPSGEINVSTVSSSWGKQVTRQGLIALGIFLVLVSLYIAIRFERQMAVGAVVALFHDLVITAGVYSIVGFEVTPATVIGLLTILGFSLYDTVVVFDKVEENAKGILGDSTKTFGEAANTAVNQTLMRSINTSITSLLPVAALLFVGAGLLGVGTLKDLALVLFVGLAAGTYSSLFLATPIVVDLKERTGKYAALKQRVLERREPALASTGVGSGRGSSGANSLNSDSSGDSDASDDNHTGAGARRGKHGRTTSHKRGR